jgi:hypothetical protein
MSTLLALQTCLTNITANRKQLTEMAAKIQSQVGTVTPDVQDAIDHLVAKIGGGIKDPSIGQKIGAIVQGQMQLEKLLENGQELDALEAAIQVVCSDDGLIQITDEQKSANVQAALSPLFGAGGGSQSLSVVEGANDDVAAASAQTRL